MAKKFSVLYDFEAKDDGELSITAHETVEVYTGKDRLLGSADDMDEDGWILVERLDGATGFVPLQYLQQLTPFIDDGVEGSADDLKFDAASGDSRYGGQGFEGGSGNYFSWRGQDVDFDAAVCGLEVVTTSYPRFRKTKVFASYRQLQSVGIIDSSQTADSCDETRAKIEVRFIAPRFRSVHVSLLSDERSYHCRSSSCFTICTWRGVKRIRNSST